jgi:type I restriction-modification system DNA methylase subunit
MVYYWQDEIEGVAGTMDNEMLLEAIGKMMDQRFEDFGKSIDQRFEDFGKSIDQRFEDFGKSIDQRFEDVEKKVDEKLSEQRKDIMHDVTLLMDLQFEKRFNALTETVDEIQKDIKRIWKRLELLDRVPILDAAVRQHSRQIEELEVRVEDLEKAN